MAVAAGDDELSFDEEGLRVRKYTKRKDNTKTTAAAGPTNA